jgi:uncharacterized protein
VITAVLDANVLASGFVRANPDSATVQTLDAWRAGRYLLILSEHLLDEVDRTLESPYFARRLSWERRANDMGLLRTRSAVIEITVSVTGVATHPEDDLVLATAVSAGADYLVTGDRKLQRLGSYEGVTIVSPRQFLDLLDEQESAMAP